MTILILDVRYDMQVTIYGIKEPVSHYDTYHHFGNNILNLIFYKSYKCYVL